MKKKLLLLTWVLVLLFSCCACATVTGEKLSEEKVQELRKQYPVYDVTAAPFATVVIQPFAEVASHMETVMDVKVIGDVNRTYIDLSGTMPADFEEAIKEKGFSYTAGFLTYQVEVIEDAGGQYDPGDIVTVSITDVLEGAIPTFQKGDRFIFMGGYDEEGQNEVGMNYQTYYVTEDGYALSSFQEEEANCLSGVKAEECVDYIFDLVQ